MTEEQWKAFCSFRDDFKAKVLEWQSFAPELGELQKKAAEKTKTPLYPFETSVVYNRDLDLLTKESQINLIVIGDNPGKDEQLSKNNRYLVGQAGKLADGFFKKNPELKTDFRKNVIILNKTPVHSAKTAQLKIMMKDGGKKISDLIEESQLWMAEKTALLHSRLVEGGNGQGPELWLVGYSELKNKGFFIPYRDALRKYDSAWDKVFVFQHFSMNRFSIDLKEFSQSVKDASRPLLYTLHDLGNIHKKEIFGE